MDSFDDSEAVEPVSLVEDSVLDVLDVLAVSAVEVDSVLVPVGASDDSDWDWPVVE